jgi:hypothetical protein
MFCRIRSVVALGCALAVVHFAGIGTSLFPAHPPSPGQNPAKTLEKAPAPTRPLRRTSFEAPAPSQAQNRPISRSSKAPANSPPAQAAPSTLPQTSLSQPLVFRNQIVFDQQFMNVEAFRFLVPKDWAFSGGITWNFNKNPPEPFTIYTVTSPDGRSVIQQFPRVNLFWSQNQMSQATYVQLGSTIMQPIGAIDFLQRVFIPQARPGVADIKVLEAQPLPALAQYALQISNMTLNLFGQISPFNFTYDNRAEAGRVQVEYTENGQRVIEDFTATLNYFIANMPTMSGMYVPDISWSASVTSFRAPAAEMPSKVRMFQISIYSRYDNPAFNVGYTRMCAIITREKLRQQQAIFARYQQIRQTLAECDDIIMQVYQNRSASFDRMFDNYSQALRGVDTYVDPVNNWNIELPTGYGNAWTNGTDYVFSDSPSYNPNIGGPGGNWTQMNRKR